MFSRKEITAVDIGSNSIKVVRMKKKGDNLELIASGKKLLPGGVVVDPNRLTDIIEDIFKIMGYRPKYVTTAVSSKNVIIRNIEFPSMSDKELDQALKIGAAEYLTFPVENSRFKYKVIDKNEEKMDILLAAVKEDIIDNYIDIFESANIKLNVINVQSMALLSLINCQLELNEPVLILDIGAGGSRIIIGDNKNIYLVRNLELGGNIFTDLIKKQHSLNDEEAEKYKRQMSLVEELNKYEGNIEISKYTTIQDLDSLSALISYFTDEIERSLEFFNKKYTDLSLNNIFITGGGSLLKGLETIIIDRLENQLQTIDPLTAFSATSNVKKDFAVAIGLVASEVMANAV